MVGLRSDLYQFDVTNRQDPSVGSGHEAAGPVNPKFSLILGPWVDTEYYLNLGTGFHSNDARNLFNPTDPTDAIARTKSAEVGMRSETFDWWTTNVAVWHQEFDSELVFNGRGRRDETGASAPAGGTASSSTTGFLSPSGSGGR